MSDIDEIIEYLKSLKKGFDKDLFQSKIDDLAHLVDSSGLEYSDFHTLFKVWLNLSIPISRWVSIGVCIVPHQVIEEHTVVYALRWLLENFKNQDSFPRVAFLLDWLTAAMDSESIDMTALDYGYEIFYAMLTYDALVAQALKLVYTLTKPLDVTRRRVLELIDCANKRESKKNMLRQIQVLLGLFKSYKPEYVPEDVPAISIHISFRKINANLVTRFQRNQRLRYSTHEEGGGHLLGMNPFSMIKTNKNCDPLLPSLEFVNIGSKQYAAQETLKTHLDFTDAVSLVAHARGGQLARPARVRALLATAAGPALLAAQPAQLQHLRHQLPLLLHHCFLESSPHSYSEKRAFLSRLSVLQNSLLEGLPAVTRMLAQYLPHWNESDYFTEILQLSEWVTVDNLEIMTFVVEPLINAFHRAQPMQQCAILRTITTMYTNVVFTCSRNQDNVICSKPSDDNYVQALSYLALRITDMCEKALQVCPDDMRLLLGSTQAAVRAAASMGPRARRPRIGRGLVMRGAYVIPRRIVFALALLQPSAAALDDLANIILLYKKIFKSTNSAERDEKYHNQIQVLKGYTSDIIRCLFSEEALSGRDTGIAFQTLHPLVFERIKEVTPEPDASWSIRNHLAFAPYTYLQSEGKYKDADNKLLFDKVIEPEFEHLGAFLKKAFRNC